MGHGSFDFDHIRASRHHWWLVVGGGVLTLACGTLRLWQYDHAHTNAHVAQPWETLREDFRESNRQQADPFALKLRAIGCEIAPASDSRKAVENSNPAGPGQTAAEGRTSTKSGGRT